MAGARRHARRRDVRGTRAPARSPASGREKPHDEHSRAAFRPESNRAAALRATGGVVAPAQAGTNPRHPLRGTRRPRDQGVVGVGHDHGPRRQLFAGLAPALRYLAHLVVAVELVAAQVEQDQHRRAHAGPPPWAARPRPPPARRWHPAPSRQRGGQAGGQVGPQEVRNHWALTAGTDGAGQQLGRGRLAVGPRDQHYLPARREPLERQRVDREDGVAPDDRARTAAGGPGESTEASSRHNSETRP